MPESIAKGCPEPVRWTGRTLRLLDQRYLPARESYVDCESADDVAGAITDMVVRGAPAIGVAAAFGLALAARADDATVAGLALAGEALKQARPTAVNLAWAVDRVLGRCQTESSLAADVLAEAQAIQAEDLRANHAMARHATECLQGRVNVYTHCNTGSLATAGFGTALGVIRQLKAEDRLGEVYVGETRPWLQGARLTAWELAMDGIHPTLVVDSAAASVMRAGRVDVVITGADRITADGGVLNKIGTYGLAVLARHHGLRMMVVAPMSTVDMDSTSASQIEIEQRPPDEVTTWAGQRHAPQDVAVFNPVFDATPYALIDWIVTEQGVFRPAIA
ncbi:S-methyl-5-thioribose-1-phosphate isomerase [uncultured Abyssibacter sp.]|uniref:S-methyl-5-thioribose-1-phosphate isomerase n=1 Tax=uncultured Abyssibacter sp. TaxID=2320202 RepID=UPI0032B1D911